jgi:hypothetical protein
MAVQQQTVRLGVSGKAREVQAVARGSSGARGPTKSVDDDAATFDQLRVEERSEREDARGRITARYGDQRRADQLFAVSFDESVDRTREQRRGRVRIPVPRVVLIFVLQSKVRPQIDDTDTTFE